MPPTYTCSRTLATLTNLPTPGESGTPAPSDKEGGAVPANHQLTNNEAFGAFVSEHNLFERLTTIAAMWLPREDAEEIANDTLVALYRAGESIGNPLAWTVAVLHNLICDAFRPKKRRVRFESASPEWLAAISDRFNPELQEGPADPSAEEIIAEVLGRLAGSIRAVFVAVAVEGKTPTEAATLCGCCPGHVYRLREQAIEFVRDVLRKKFE